MVSIFQAVVMGKAHEIVENQLRTVHKGRYQGNTYHLHLAVVVDVLSELLSHD